MVGVLDQLAEQLGDLDVLVVHLPDDPRGPMNMDLLEFGSDVDPVKMSHGSIVGC